MKSKLHIIHSSFFLLITLTSSLATSAQQYINGTLSTGAVSNNGVIAPAGYTWSELQNNTSDATTTNVTEGMWIGGVFKNKMADDFVVPAGQIWGIHNFEFFIFRDDINFQTLPVVSMGIEIWNGDPSVNTSVKIYGDLTTDVLDLSNCNEAHMFAIKNSNFTESAGGTPSLSRKIWKIRGNFNVSLNSGTYWILFQPVYPNNVDIKMPLTKVAGSRGYPQNSSGRYRDGSPGNYWVFISDGGYPFTSTSSVPQDFPFIINYDLTLSNKEVSLLEKIEIYPNPIHHEVNISWSDLNITMKQIIITDIRGALVNKTIINSTNNKMASIDISTLPKGMYFLQATDAANKTITRKIVKE